MQPRTWDYHKGKRLESVARRMYADARVNRRRINDSCYTAFRTELQHLNGLYTRIGFTVGVLENPFIWLKNLNYSIFGDYDTKLYK